MRFNFFRNKRPASIDRTPAKKRRSEAHQQWVELAERLDELGFWYQENQSTRQRQKQEMVDEENLHGLESPRFIFADAEYLAEGGIASWFLENSELLARFGADPTRVEEGEYSDALHSIVLDGDRVVVCEFSHLVNIENTVGTLWRGAARFTVNLLNRLLTEGGSPNRAYWVGGDNDGLIWILTPEMERTISDSWLINTKDLPAAL